MELITDMHAFEAGVPGIYLDVPSDVYHAVDACSKSRLERIHQYSARHGQHYIEHGIETTDAMKLGDAEHVALLQPELVERRFITAGQCEAITSKGAQCSNEGSTPRVDGDGHVHWYCGVKSHDPGLSAGTVDERIVLSRKDLEKVEGMAKAVVAHPITGSILAAEGYTEVSLLWKDEETGLLCKARIDKWLVKDGILHDWKSCSDAREHAFRRTIEAMGYDRQAAMYLAGGRALGIQADEFSIGAVESGAPHGITTWSLERSDLQVKLAEMELREAMQIYADCKAREVAEAKESRIYLWPSYEERIYKPQPSEWRIQRWEEIL